MRILLLHNRYQQRGGEDAVVDAERALLVQAGHEVELLEVSNESLVSPFSKLEAGVGTVYSLAGKRATANAIACFRPDVVHAHNTFPLLSPAAYDACQDAGVPVVQTLHNFRLVCPGAQLFREGAPCERCVGQAVPWASIQHGCYRGSRAQTAAVAAMVAIHRWRRTWASRVDAFIALTAFQKDRLVAGGLPADKIHLKPNFAEDPMPALRSAPGDYALFVGRLSPEKGIDVLLDAYATGHPGVPLLIAGDGPMRPQLERRLEGSDLGERVRLLGQQDRPALSALLAGARCLVLPSRWYEGFPMVVLEAFAHGVPVMASQIGGLPEIVQAGHNGWWVGPGDSAAWSEALAQAASDPDAAMRLGKSARADYEAHYTPEAGYQRLMAIYDQIKGGTC
jgi:glycosyltransferase involved in cell wall biosynthesis